MLGSSSFFFFFFFFFIPNKLCILDIRCQVICSSDAIVETYTVGLLRPCSILDLLARPWMSHLPSLDINFLICEMGDEVGNLTRAATQGFFSLF
jgi:hypothetical protein